MAQTFSNWAQIEKHLNGIIQKVLEEDVSLHVKECIQTNVGHTIYNSGTPLYYKRRGENANGGISASINGSGSIGDINTMTHAVNNGELTVTPEAKGFNRDFDNLAEKLEFGYGKEWYSLPRPFIEETRKDLKETQSHVDVMREGLIARGLNVVK